MPVIELDKLFWREDLTHPSRADWAETLRTLALAERWIMDGDLGPLDALEHRLARADTILVIEVSLARRAWRTARRSRERWDFWLWMVGYHWRSRPALMREIAIHGKGAALRILRGPAAVGRFLAEAVAARGDRP